MTMHASITPDLKNRVQVAADALSNLERWQAETLLWEMFGQAGFPLSPLCGHLREARHWARVANIAERKAYLLAAFEALPASEQRAFTAYVEGQA